MTKNFRQLTLREKINKRVWMQCFVLALVAGPLVWVLKGDLVLSALAWCCGCMFVAPLIVEALRPTLVPVRVRK